MTTATCHNRRHSRLQVAAGAVLVTIIATLTLLSAATWALAVVEAEEAAAEEAAPAVQAPAAAAAPAPAPAVQQRQQLRNLADKPTGPRFRLPTERVWPANPGQADICLWDGDRFAAMSITIDDNWATDHQWWLQETAKHGQKITWFVITRRVGTGGVWGDWQGFQNLRDQGHQVQSHTVTHLRVDEEGWPGIEGEYRDSAAAIQANLKEHRVTVLAYPGGGNSARNDRDVAARFYIAARGVIGTPNMADRIDYMSTNSTSGTIDRDRTDAVLFGRSGIAWMGNNKYLRGWLCTHFHGVPQAAQRTAVAGHLAYIKSVEADLWLGLFDEVARYGQQRDTATLTVTENTAQKIVFTLTDRMDDELFDYPLTVKVRLYDNWPAAAAVQGDKPAQVTIVEHQGARFALVKAIPDRGPVTLTPAAAAPAAAAAQ